LTEPSRIVVVAGRGLAAVLLIGRKQTNWRAVAKEHAAARGGRRESGSRRPEFSELSGNYNGPFRICEDGELRSRRDIGVEPFFGGADSQRKNAKGRGLALPSLSDLLRSAAKRNFRPVDSSHGRDLERHRARLPTRTAASNVLHGAHHGRSLRDQNVAELRIIRHEMKRNLLAVVDPVARKILIECDGKRGAGRYDYRHLRAGIGGGPGALASTRGLTRERNGR
jgi:hypothetical protein